MLDSTVQSTSSTQTLGAELGMLLRVTVGMLLGINENYDLVLHSESEKASNL